MLVIIGVEFDPPITLPYNFNLSRAGGLLGIKRSMSVGYLREGLSRERRSSTYRTVWWAVEDSNL